MNQIGPTPNGIKFNYDVNLQFREAFAGLLCSRLSNEPMRRYNGVQFVIKYIVTAT